MNHERLWTLGSKLRVLEERGMRSLVMGNKEGTYFMEHWVLYTNSVSWNTTSKTNDRRDKMARESRKRHLFNLYSKAS